MAALASYGRQANDDTLVHMAMRIQARAIRKAGELLQNISSAQGMRTDRLQEGDRPKSPRNEAAREAGFSEHQQKQALRVANLDEDEFEQAIEGHKPATITELAERGTKSRESPFNGKEPTGRTHSYAFLGLRSRCTGFSLAGSAMYRRMQTAVYGLL
jgi:hypothetical protein